MDGEILESNQVIADQSGDHVLYKEDVPNTGGNFTRALGNRPPPDHDRLVFAHRYENELVQQGRKVSRHKNRSAEKKNNSQNGGLPRIPVDSDNDQEFRIPGYFNESDQQENALRKVNDYERFNNRHISQGHRGEKQESHFKNGDLVEDTNGDIGRDKSNSKERLSSKKHRRSRSDSTQCTRTVSNGGPVNDFNKEKLSSKHSRQSRKSQGSHKSTSDRKQSHISNDCNGNNSAHSSRKTRRSDKRSSSKEETPREMATLSNKISIDSYDMYPRYTNRTLSSECQSIASNGGIKKEPGRRRSRNKNYDKPIGEKPNDSSCCGFKTSQRRCLVTLLALSVVITLALAAAGFVIYASMKGTNRDSLLYDMVRAHVRLRIINRSFTASMKNPDSTEFQSLDNIFCREIDLRYLTSALYVDYFGCSLQEARNGSIDVYFMSPFLDTELTSKVSIHRDILLKDGFYLSSDSGSTTLSSASAHKVTLGEFIIEVSSIEIFLEKYKTDRLPPRPRLSKQVTKKPSKSAGVTVTDSPNDLENRNRETSGGSKTEENTYKQTTASTKTDGATEGEGYKHWTKTKVMDWLSSTLPIPRALSYGMTTLTPHQIVSIDSEKATLGEKASITCLISTVEKIQSLTITKSDQNTKTSMVIEVSGDELKLLPSRKLHTNNLVVINKTDAGLAVSLDFSSVQCEDIGEYKCSIKTETDIHESSIGKLDGTELPVRPILSLPHDLVENRELSKPITCSANVGFPPGYIQWLIKPKGSTSFFPFEGNYVNVTGSCNNHVTNSLIYTPTTDGNGTLLKCVVINNDVTVSTDLTVMAEIQILPENLCDNVPINTLIRHPFTCTKYIRCDGRDYEVLECAQQMCFDEASGKCGQISLTMPSVTAILNDGVALIKCYLVHRGAWRTITISKKDISGDKIKILTALRGVTNISYGESPMQGRIHTYVDETKQYQVEVSLWIELMCEDGGQYVCEAEAPYEIPTAKGHITVQVQPNAPKLSIPNEIVEGSAMRTNITCEADVGFPFGSLVLKVKRPGDTDYTDVPDQMTAVPATQNCSQIVKASFTFLPKLNHNGMMIRCELENNDTLPLDHKFIAEERIHVIPANFCQSVGDKTIHEHPYDCHQYVSCLGGYIYVQRCGSSLCFDPNTLRCDKEDETTTTFDPRRPCKPDKNGVFFRHPVLCNKFFWCVQGKEVVKHCPSGTLYIDGGQCTFEPERSLCYQEKALT